MQALQVRGCRKDFKQDWQELVVTPYKALANPETETQTTADGWKVVTGASAVKLDGFDVYILLTVTSGFGKTVTVRCSMNDQAYTTQIDALFATMEFDKTKIATVNNNNTVTTPTTGGTGKFGAMMYTAPAGWGEEIFSDGVVFKPSDIPAGEHLAIQIMEPLNISGTLEQALAQSFAEATTTYNATSMYEASGKYTKNAVQKSFNGWEYIRGKGGIKDAGGNELGLELFVVKINNRFERVAILESRKYCGGTTLYYATDRRTYRNGIEQLLFSLHFLISMDLFYRRGQLMAME